MSSSTESNTGLAKIQALFERLFKDTTQKTINISFKELKSKELEENLLYTEAIFKTIEDNSEGNIIPKIKHGRVQLPTLAGQNSAYPIMSDPRPVGIEVYISDPKKLPAYFKIISNNINVTKQKTVLPIEQKHRPEIKLNTGMYIKGKQLLRTGEKSNKKVFNQTDEDLLYFLYYEFLQDEKSCFNLIFLMEKLGKAKGTIKNRIGEINQIIKDGVSIEKNAIPDLIKLEGTRKGYYLNPMLVSKSQK
jgi:hypothetical protein